MIDRVDGVVATPIRDDTAGLVTLTAREINPTIVAGGREQENLHLLHQGVANEVIDVTSAVGRMLGFALESPRAVGVLDDLIDAGSGLELVECGPEDLGNGSTIVAIVRGGPRLPPAEVSGADVRPGDRLLVVRETKS